MYKMPQTLTLLESLGINIFELAETAKRLRNYTQERIDSILVTADKKIKPKPKDLPRIVLDLCYDEVFLGLARVPYDDPNSRLIKAAIADYLLTHQNQT